MSKWLMRLELACLGLATSEVTFGDVVHAKLYIGIFTLLLIVDCCFFPVKKE